MFYNGWEEIFRVFVLGVLGYVALVVVLRASGKRTLSAMNMFDFIATVAIGSTFASLILSKETALATGVAAFSTIVLMQYIVAWLSVRSEFLLELVKARPTLLYYRGDFLTKEMRRKRIPMQELHYVLRQNGFTSFDGIRAIVLETNGKFSVVLEEDTPKENVISLTGVRPNEKTARRETPLI